MIGVKLTAFYSPDNALTPLDPAGGVWGDALGHFEGPPPEPLNTGWMGAILAYEIAAMQYFYEMFNGTPTFQAVDVVVDAGEPLIRAVVVVSDGTLGMANLEQFHTDFTNAASSLTAIAAMTDFDTLNSVSFSHAEFEYFSNENVL